jgi:hypothetical protein
MAWCLIKQEMYIHGMVLSLAQGQFCLVPLPLAILIVVSEISGWGLVSAVT